MLFHSQASDIGDQISRIVKDFADEGLGTADMQVSPKFFQVNRIPILKLS